ncbi:hypothetical protein SAMN05216604_13321 [Pseudomonas agarici]|nr:hypothetical protein SAMN05216604_13321 [Pseudomonas agarici]
MNNPYLSDTYSEETRGNVVARKPLAGHTE